MPVQWDEFEPAQAAPSSGPIEWSDFEPVEKKPAKPGVLANLINDLTTVPDARGGVALPTLEPPTAAQLNQGALRPGPTLREAIRDPLGPAAADLLRRSSVGQAILGPVSQRQIPGHPADIGLLQAALTAPSPFTPAPETVAGKALLGYLVAHTALQAPEQIAAIKDSIDKKDWHTLRGQVGDAAFNAAFTAIGLHGLFGVKAGVAERVPVIEVQSRVSPVEPEPQPVERQIPPAAPGAQAPKAPTPPPKPPKPTVPGTEDIQQILPELTQPGVKPILPAKPLETYQDFVEDLKQRGSPDLTKDQIRAMYPQLGMSREAASMLAHDAFGDQWKGRQDARAREVETPSAVPAELGQPTQPQPEIQTQVGAPQRGGEDQGRPQAQENVPPEIQKLTGFGKAFHEDLATRATTNKAFEWGKKANTIEDLNHIVAVRQAYDAIGNQFLKAREAETDPAKRNDLLMQAHKWKSLLQFPSEALEVALNIPGKTYPLKGKWDINTQPEMADWLRKNAPWLAFRLEPPPEPPPAAPAPTPPAPAPPAAPPKPPTDQPLHISDPDGINQWGVSNKQWEEMAHYNDADQRERWGFTRAGAMEFKMTGNIRPGEKPPGAQESPAPPAAAPAPTPPAAGPTTSVEPDENTQVTPAMRSAMALVPLIQTGTPLTKSVVHDVMAIHHGGTLAEGKFTAKDQSDVLEMAVNLSIFSRPNEYNPGNQSPEQATQTVLKLKEMLKLLPTQTSRTPETDKMQQFSTPPPLGFVANWVGKPAPTDVVLEGSAGLAGLAVFAKNSGATVIANELSPRRRAMLEAMSKAGVVNQVTGHNAELLHALMYPAIRAGRTPQPTMAIMNPPFSSSAMTTDKKTLIGAQHIEQALNLLPTGGRLVAIVGQGMAMHRPMFVSWWRKIARSYNIRANIGINGEEYRKYGTAFDNQIIVIDKSGPTLDLGRVVTGDVDKVEDLIPLLEGVRNDRPPTQQAPTQPSGPPPPAPRTPPTGTPGPGNVPSPTGAGGAVPGRPTPPGGPPPPQAPGGLQPKPTPPTVSPPTTGQPTGTAGRTEGQPPGPGGEHKPLFEGGDAGISVEQKEEAQRQLSDTGVYSEYVPQKIRIPGAQPHPTPLVESTAMASVEPVDPKYTPSLSKTMVEKGHLSNPQLEQIIYAGQAHENELPTGERQGYFIGDGTGVGKGREITGIFVDNWNKGRDKGVWVSAKPDLIEDAKRDFMDVGIDPKHLINLGPKGGKALLGLKQGIAFATYTSLSKGNDGLDPHVPADQPQKLLPPADPDKPSRLHLLYNYLGPDFDGVIAFDEAHYAGNAIDLAGSRGIKRASKRGLMVLDLQKLFPKARIVYVSATGATDVTNLSYADRLGIWGPGTPFPNKQAFFNAIQAGGLSAMEIVARDLKATGKYLARTLSFEGVTHEQLTHELTPEQIKIYDELSRAWQLVLQNQDKTMARTGMNNNGQARGQANSRFYGAQQRFYNQLLTAMQTPSILARMKQSLAAGNSPMVSIVNTNEATLKRELAKKVAEADEGSDWVEDLDLSPKDILLEYIDSNYPTELYQPVTDANGNTRWVPVTDEQGRRVDDPQALQEKQHLMDTIKLLKAPRNPLEMIIDTFGAENVAEITGRTKRVIQKLQPDGTRKAVVEHRSKANRQVEAQEFLDDKRRILIRSDAGGTGFSFQAGRKFKNQRRRDDILAQAGWRADNALQTMGRSHRSDQVSAPNYIPVSTNLSGHKRFISTIMRRLSELGALTGGERRASSREMFDEGNNLENAYAEAGVLIFFRHLFAGEIEGLGFDDLSHKMGFTYTSINERSGEVEIVNKLIDSQTGALNQEAVPEVHTFLNRILVLEVGEQNRTFEGFDQIRRQIIDNAKADGSYDPGTQTVKALAIRKIKDETVYRDPNSTAKTRLVEVESDHPVKLLTWEKKDSIASDKPIIEYVQNIRSGKVFALKEGPDKTLENGQIVPQWRRVHPTGSEIVQRSTINTEPIYGSPANFKSLTPEQAERLWNDEVSKAPKVKTSKDTYIVGAMLPIWDRLRLHRPKIWRMTTSEGENLLGVHVPENAIEDLRDRLGASGGEQPSPKGVFDKVLDRGGTVELANGWVIKRSRVQGDNRIEVRNVELNQHQEFERFIGGYIERINYEPRAFLKTDEDEAIKSLTRILNKSPVITRRPGSAGIPPTGYFDRSSEAAGLSRLSGAPSIEDIRAARAAELSQGVIADPVIGPMMLYSGVPFPTTMAELRDFVMGVKNASAAAREFWQEFSMKAAPKLTDADRASGEAGVRLAQAPYVAREKGLIFAGKVMAGITSLDFDTRLGAAVTEDNLRDIKQRNLDLADEVRDRDELIEQAREEIENWREDARAGDTEAKQVVRDLRRRIAQLEAYEPEDEARFRALAAGVFTFIGAEGSPFHTEADYDRFLNDPNTKLALDRHRPLWREQKDPLFRIANDLDPDTPLQTRGIRTGARINLKPVHTSEEDSPTVVGKRPARSPLIRQAATIKRTDPFRMRAEGQAKAYESSYTELIANGFEREYPVGAQHDFINTMIENGVAALSQQEFPQKFEIMGEPTKAYRMKWRPWRDQWLQIPKSLAPEYEAITGLKPADRIPYFTKSSEFLTRQSIIGFAEGSTHVTNLLMEVFTGLGPTSNPMINALIKSMGRADLLYTLPRVLILGMMDSKEEMIDLATIGAAKQPYSGKLMGPLLNLVDRGVRLNAASLHRRMGEAGWVVNNETNLREFVNQVGNYNKKLQPWWLRFLRDTHLQPFATAVQTFNILGVKRMAFAPGTEATSARAAAALRLDIAAGAIGFMILLALINKMLSGKVEGPKGTRLGAIGWIDKDGKLHQFDVGKLTGWTRGASAFGIQDFVEAKRLGESTETAARAGMRAFGNTALTEVAGGPGVQFLSKAITGKRIGIPAQQEAKVMPPQEHFNLLKSQMASNIKTALRQANPIVDSTIGVIEGRPALEIAQRQFSRFTPRTGLSQETIENLPRIAKTKEINDYADALAKESHKVPVGQRPKWLIDQLNHDQLSPEIKARAIIELRRRGAFTYP